MTTQNQVDYIYIERDSKEIKQVNPKGNQPWIVIEGTDAEAPVLWPLEAKSQPIRKDPDAGKDWRQKKRETENELLDNITDSMHMKMDKFQKLAKDREVWRAVVQWDCKVSDMT